MGGASDKVIAQIKSLRRTTADGNPYVANQNLQTIFERNTIIATLKECAIPEWRISSLATSVREGGVVVFAILTWIQRPETIVDFVDKQELDDRLPFKENDLPSINPDVPQFFDAQWAFLPVYLREGGFRKFRDREVLPFQTESAEPSLDGSFGVISKVTIDPSMHDFVPEQCKEASVFIRKQLRPGSKNRDQHAKELSCLEALRLLEHTNIVRLLYSYTQGSRFNFIFPCLDMDLSEFLVRDERFGNFVEDDTFYQALQGLASAIHAVHNFKIQGEVDMDFIIYHHDLRPANILVTPNTFMLADFGLSKIKPPEKGSKTEWPDTFSDYIAPECMDENFRNQTVGRSIDIWAFGCLIVEVATYMAEESEGVTSARKERARLVSEEWRVANSYFWLGNSMRPEVLHHMEKLQMNRGSGIFSLLETAKTLLEVNVETRPRAEDALRALSAVATQCIYTDVVASLDEYEASLRTTEHRLSALDVWMEKRKLHMWGSPLGMHTKQLIKKSPHSLLDVEATQRAQQLLRELQGICRTVLSAFATSPRENEEEDESRKPSLGYSPTISHEIRKRIEALYNLLPAQTLRQVSIICEKDIINTIDSHDLDSMGDVLDLESEPHQEMASMALLRGLKDSLVRLSSTDEEAKRLRLEEHQITELTRLPDGYHEIADLRENYTDTREKSTSRRVLVESVPYSESWRKWTPTDRAERIAALAKLLAQKKPKGLRVLDCIGYILPNQEGYSLVFRFPDDGANSVPETLLGYLRKAIPKPQKSVLRGVPEKPALEERYSLALTLAQSVFELHSIGWLHKALNSNNILFFSEPSNFGRPKLSKPYLVDFRFSRPNGPSLFTDGPVKDRGFVEYVHPDYFEERKIQNDREKEARFRQLYDYYSLGVILLEIGYWSPIENILSQHRTEYPSALTEILLTKYIPRLGAVMGRLYMQVTRACVDGSIQESEDGSSGLSSQDFYSCVIEPLSRIFVG